MPCERVHEVGHAAVGDVLAARKVELGDVGVLLQRGGEYGDALVGDAVAAREVDRRDRRRRLEALRKQLNVLLRHPRQLDDQVRPHHVPMRSVASRTSSGGILSRAQPDASACTRANPNTRQAKHMERCDSNHSHRLSTSKKNSRCPCPLKKGDRTTNDGTASPLCRERRDECWYQNAS
eukprot:1344466-Pleurochrysis_carterae.AAC.2